MMAARKGSEPLGFDELLKEMTFDFFGSGEHKMTVEQLLSEPGAVLLDVRSNEEIGTLNLPFSHDVTTLRIPTTEIPDRLHEIPADRQVAVFCSAGTRSAIVYAYLRTMGLDRARVLVGGYGEIAEHAKPGKLWKRMNGRSGS